MIVGGIVLLAVDRMRLEPRFHDVMDLPLSTAFVIGLAQCLAMIPGVSRSGSTIVGALLLGADKRAATEFSFFLAMPTMAGAFAYDLYKNYAELTVDDADGHRARLRRLVRGGGAGGALSARLRQPPRLRLFAWWRIIVGGMGLGALAILG